MASTRSVNSLGDVVGDTSMVGAEAVTTSPATNLDVFDDGKVSALKMRDI